MMVSGVGFLVTIVLYLIGLFILYWVTRLAVRHAINDTRSN
jgi:hypothetical protein